MRRRGTVPNSPEWIAFVFMGRMLRQGCALVFSEARHLEEALHLIPKTKTKTKKWRKTERATR